MKEIIENLKKENELIQTKRFILDDLISRIKRLDMEDVTIIFNPELKTDVKNWVESLGFIFDGENSDDPSSALIKFK